MLRAVKYLGTITVQLFSPYIKMTHLESTRKLEKPLVKKLGALLDKSRWRFYLRSKWGHEILICFRSGLRSGNVHMDMDHKTGSRVVRNGSYQRYKRKGRKYQIGEILPLLTRRKKKVKLDGDLIKISTARLLTFRRCGTTCVSCGLKGEFFVKEKHKKGDSKSFHLNLYGKNKHGSEVLMTSDHIIPKSKGGSDGVRNRQTMCIHCNGNKADNYNEEERKKGVFK